jgi:hypothetical protein
VDKKIINLTSQDYFIEDGNGFIKDDLIVSEGICRVKMGQEITSYINNLPVQLVKYEVEGLPEPQDGVVYLVSLTVLMITDRKDVVAPRVFVYPENEQVLIIKGFISR